MKHRIALRDSTMQAKEHWLEVETGRSTQISLMGPKGRISDAIVLTQQMARELAAMQPGVIIEAGPMRFYRTEDDVRISFTEPGEEGEPAGFDRFDADEFTAAFDKPRKVTPKPRKEVKRASKSSSASEKT